MDMPIVAIVVLAAGTLAFRLAGPLFRDRVRIPPRLEDLLSLAALVLLFALVVTSSFAGWARPAGVLVAGVLAVRKAPFPVIVIAAAATTAVLRLIGVP
ncbi:AzlD domain-containing protein [Herbidospora sp. NEAU-GS84]|uniref:AzlD domain-containing protein n=1 Tax=Herbidospora solisilvae TaxID=2696284 RepID=A0A7C9JPX2_9ACTN|nr:MULTISPECIES: AzlD domain-containing protein [Herbidospora]NAS20299.1 AzlD domain-containing protein [Herbidospora solisilvae]